MLSRSRPRGGCRAGGSCLTRIAVSGPAGVRLIRLGVTPGDVDAFAITCEALAPYQLVNGAALLAQGPTGFRKNPALGRAALGRGEVCSVRRSVRPNVVGLQSAEGGCGCRFGAGCGEAAV